MNFTYINRLIPLWSVLMKSFINVDKLGES
jgi:hypothetical protein